MTGFRRLCLAALALGAGVALDAEAADLVITKSTVPGLDAGTVIDGGQSLTLKAGHKLSLISSSGKVINLTGPYQGVPDPSAGGSNRVVDALASLVTMNAQDTSQLGVVRAPDSRHGNARFIDITAPGPRCVLAGQRLTLWQPSGQPVESLWIARSGSSEAAVVKWQANEAVQPWPASLAVADGVEYSLLHQPARTEVKITLRVLPASLTNPAEQAAAMAERGCGSQAMALLTAE